MGGQLLIRIYDRADYRGELELAVGDAAPQRVRYEGSGEEREVCRVTTPGEGAPIRLRGEFSWQHHSRGRQQVRGSQEWNVADLAPMLSVLRDDSVPLGKRMIEFARAKERFDQARPELAAEIPAPVTLGRSASGEEIALAERRIGFALPPEHVSLLAAGGVTLAECCTVDLPSVRAYETIVREWSTPEDSLAEESAALYRSGVFLFAESGDGMGGLMYTPGEEGGYYWVHEGSINRPRLLTQRSGRRTTYAEALIWMCGRLVFSLYEDWGAELALVDGSARGPVALELRHDGGGPALGFRIAVDWDAFE